MITTLKTKYIDDSEKKKLYNKLCSNFAMNELRSFKSQLKAFLHPEYRVSFISIDNIGDAFSLWWDFSNFIFIEYIVVDTSLQRKGIGSLLLSDICSKNKTIILEVKKDSLKESFFKNNGFVYNSYCYEAISLMQNIIPNKYIIYSYGNHLNEKEYLMFVEQIHKDEYQF